jgi:hypothetical protein
MSTQFCESCGNALEAGSTFCNNCGKSTTVTPTQASAPVQAPVQSYSAPSSTYTAPQPQPVYQAAPPNYQAGYQPNYQQGVANDKPLSVGEYILTFIVMGIPIVGFIMTLVWAFGSNANINKRNYCRAYLILALIVIVLYILLMIVFGAFLLPIFKDAFSSGEFSTY